MYDISPWAAHFGVESAATEIARNKDAQGLQKNKLAAKAGGSVAGNARRQLEAKSGRKVITRDNYLIEKPKPTKAQRHKGQALHLTSLQSPTIHAGITA